MGLFGAAIGLSAYLLFWMEPFIGQLILPTFGGTAAVWATVLVFFQVAVLAGYLYSHLSVTRLPLRRGVVLHLVLAGVAIGWLTIVPLRQGTLRSTDLPVALDVLRMLALTIGLPIVVLTSTTPLLSSWLAAVRGPRPGGGGGDPYRLYALSNFASLVALVAYPFIVGPLVGLSRQGLVWAAGFVVFCALLVTLGLATIRGPRAGGADAQVAAPPEVPPLPAADVGGGAGDRMSIGWDRRARWILLAAVPSGLLAAVTNFIAADLIAAPLLWIGPLALYLGSFIVAFSARGRRLVPGAVLLAPAAVTLLWSPIGSAGGWPIAPLIVLEWAGLAIVATALHGRLAADRPEAARLTEFYLVQAIGGVLGGAFVAIAAPILFDGVWEYPILLVGALAALAVTGPGRSRVAAAGARPRSGLRRLDLRPFISGGLPRLAPFVAVAVVLTVIMGFDHSIAGPVAVRWFMVGALVLLVGGPPRFLAVATATVLAFATFVLPSRGLFEDRSFFGVTAVIPSADGRWTLLMNGTTVHGEQATDPVLRPAATFYYAPSGPLGDVVRLIDADRPSAAIAVAGLGAGGISSYERPTDTFTFFEIDPVVIRVARDTRYFSYLADAPVPPRIVAGDARLSLRDVPNGSYDLLILDAFSSDSPPAHLLTVEALADDLRALRPGGVLLIHVSNRYYDLAPPLGAAGERLGVRTLERRYSPTPADVAAYGASPSIWVVATDEAAMIDRLRGSDWHDIDHAGIEPPTDDHPDLLRFLALGH